MKKLFIFLILTTPFWTLAQETALQEEHDFRFSIQLMNKEMYDLAAIQFDKFTDNYPTSPNAPQAMINAASCYEKMDSLNVAAKYYYDLVLKFPQSELVDQALYNRGILLQKMGDHLNAALNLERLLIFTPSSNLVPAAQLLAAQSFIQIKDYSKALNAANVVIEKYPSHPERSHAHLIIAEIYGYQGKMEYAFSELDKVSGNNLENEITQQAFLLKAKLFRDSGRYSLSDSLLENLIQARVVNDFVLEAGYQLALSYQAFGDYQKSIKVATGLLNKKSAGILPSKLVLVTGDNYAMLKEYETALSYYTQCDTSIIDNNWDTAFLYRLGFVFQKLNRKEESSKVFEQILNNPGAVDTYILFKSLETYALILKESNNAIEAVDFLQQSLQNPVYSTYQDKILYILGEIQETGLNDWAGARSSYSAIQSAALKSDLADQAQIKICQTFEKEGNIDQALREYKRFLNIYPASDQYQNVKVKADILEKQLPVASSGTDLIAKMFLQDLNSASSAQTLADLAGILINERHDYQTAISFIEKAVAADMTESLDLEKLAFEKAYCHAVLSEINYANHQPIKAKAHKDTLNQLYSHMQAGFPNSEQTFKTYLYKIKLDLMEIESPEHVSRYLDSTLVKIPEDMKSDPQYVALELMQIHSLLDAKSDTTNWLNLQKANMICSGIQSQTNDPELVSESQLLNAEILYKLAETDSAVKVLSQIKQNNAVGVQSQYLLARLYQEEEMYDKALRIYNTIASSHYYSPLAIEAVKNSVGILYELDRIKEARALIDQYLEYKGNEYLPNFFFDTQFDELIWLSAKLSDKNQEPVKATQDLQRYLYTSNAPKHQAEALLLLGDIARESNNNEIAIGHYTELVQKFPGDTLAQSARESIADIFFQMEDYQQALQHFKSIKSQQTGDKQIFAYSREVVCEFRLGNLAKAKNLAKQFSKTYKDQDKYEAEFLYEEGMLQIKLKNFDEAEDAFKDLSKKYDDIPEGAKGDLGLARMYVITGKPEDALKILTQIPEDYDDPIILATAYLNLADFYYENRLLPQCIAANEKVLGLVDSGNLHKSAMNLLIKTYDQFKLGDKAIALIREFIEKYPNDPDIMIKKIQIGILLHDIKDYDRSISYLKNLKPFVSSTDEPEVQYYIALSYMDKGDFDQAIVEFLKVKYLSKDTKLPWKVSSLYQAGIAYRKLGNYDKAIELLQQVVREQGAVDSFGQAAASKIKEIESERAQL